jgi:hypothetical protein
MLGIGVHGIVDGFDVGRPTLTGIATVSVLEVRSDLPIIIPAKKAAICVRTSKVLAESTLLGDS